jgi:hypothetical protein
MFGNGRNLPDVGFEVFTAVVRKSINFWDITQSSALSVNRRFGGTYPLHLQGRKNKSSKIPARKQAGGKQTPCHLFTCWFLAGIYFFDPED